MASFFGDQARQTKLSQSEFGESGAYDYVENYLIDLKHVVANILVDKASPIGSCGFFLGISGLGTGSNQLGSCYVAGSEPTRVFEFNVIQDYDDQLTASTYNDTGVSTVFWNNSGSVIFGTGSNLAAPAGDAVILYRFDSLSNASWGSVVSDVGSVGSYVGSVLDAVVLTNGPVGSAVLFPASGSPEIRSMFSGALPAVGELSFWFKPGADFTITSGSAVSRYLVSKFEALNSNFAILLRGEDYVGDSGADTGSLVVKVEATTGSTIISASRPDGWINGSTYHVSFNYSVTADTYSLAVNGSVLSSGALGHDIQTIGGSLIIGAGSPIDTGDVVLGSAYSYGFVFDDFRLNGRLGSLYEAQRAFGLIGSVLQTTDLKGSDIQLSNFNRSKTWIEGDNTDSLVGSFTFNGASFTPAILNVDQAGSPIGSDLRLRLVDATGQTILTRVQSEFKSEGYP